MTRVKYFKPGQFCPSCEVQGRRSAGARATIADAGYWQCEYQHPVTVDWLCDLPQGPVPHGVPTIPAQPGHSMIRKTKPEFACAGCAIRGCTPTGEVIWTVHGWLCTSCNNNGHWHDHMLEPVPLLNTGGKPEPLGELNVRPVFKAEDSKLLAETDYASAELTAPMVWAAADKLAYYEPEEWVAAAEAAVRVGTNQPCFVVDSLTGVQPPPVASAPDAKPCPFCKSTEQGVVKGPDGSIRRLVCHECGAEGPPLLVSISDEQAALVAVVNNWNRRAGDACANGCKIKKALRDFVAGMDASEK